MKSNKITIICLVAAAILTAGVLIAQAAGFVSFEDNNKIYLWDNVRMVGTGIKMSPDGANDTELVPGGVLKIMNKDLFVRGLVGFECLNYPDNIDCKAAIGNIGNAFLTMDQISSVNDLSLISQNSNIILNALLDGSINITGQLMIKNNKNLVAADTDLLPSNFSSLGNSVFVNSLSVNEIRDTNLSDEVDGTRIGLTLPEIRFDEIRENETASGHSIMFYPRRIINLNMIVNGTTLGINASP